LHDFAFLIKWLESLSPETRKTWDCEYCASKRLQQARNCEGQYNTTAIMLSPDIVIDTCPISELKDPYCSEIYSLIKSSLLAEFKGNTPSELLGELNIYFVYKQTILSAEHDYTTLQKEK